MAKTILVAVALLSGGLLVKDVLKPFEVQPGEELTTKKLEQLGLSEADIASLKDKGSIAEIDVREAEATADVDDSALKAAIARAEKAEGEVKTLTDNVDQLTKDLAEATKPKPGAA